MNSIDYQIRSGHTDPTLTVDYDLEVAGLVIAAGASASHFLSGLFPYLGVFIKSNSEGKQGTVTVSASGL